MQQTAGGFNRRLFYFWPYSSFFFGIPADSKEIVIMRYHLAAYHNAAYVLARTGIT
jgi:hypothetical protein